MSASIPQTTFVLSPSVANVQREIGLPWSPKSRATVRLSYGTLSVIVSLPVPTFFGSPTQLWVAPTPHSGPVMVTFMVGSIAAQGDHLLNIRKPLTIVNTVARGAAIVTLRSTCTFCGRRKPTTIRTATRMPRKTSAFLRIPTAFPPEGRSLYRTRRQPQAHGGAH